MTFDIREYIIENNDARQIEENTELERIVKKAGFSFDTRDGSIMWWAKKDSKGKYIAQVRIKKDGKWDVDTWKGDVRGSGATALIAALKKLKQL